MTDAPSRDDAIALDAADPLARWRDEFVVPRRPDGTDLVYLDGNSLGMASQRALAALRHAAEQEWALGLIGSWDEWLDRPRRVGDRLAPLVGAPAGTVVVHDSTTIDLYRLVHAALAAAAHDGNDGAGNGRIAVDTHEFPTDRYVVGGVAAATGREVQIGFDDLDGVAVAVRSVVDYRTAERADVAAETERARAAGTIVVWDLSHAAGAIEIDLAADGVELAVGCSYKFLSGGPGAPAWSYVAAGRQADLAQPIWGWFAQRDQFAMDAAFDPYPDVRRLLAGTPGILALAVADAAIGIVADAGMPAIAAKGSALTGLALDLCDRWGLESPTPRDPARRGAHVAVRVADAAGVHAELVHRGVVTDVRQPDLIRIGCSPLTTRFVDVHDGMTALRDTLGAPT